MLHSLFLFNGVMAVVGEFVGGGEEKKKKKTLHDISFALENREKSYPSSLPHGSNQQKHLCGRSIPQSCDQGCEQEEGKICIHHPLSSERFQF